MIRWTTDSIDDGLAAQAAKSSRFSNFAACSTDGVAANSGVSTLSPKSWDWWVVISRLSDLQIRQGWAEPF